MSTGTTLSGGIPRSLNSTTSSNSGTDPNVEVIFYKRDLLKRKFDDEVAEGWIACKSCKKTFHQVCVLFNSRGVGASRKWGPPFLCPFCVFPNVVTPASEVVEELGRGGLLSRSDSWGTEMGAGAVLAAGVKKEGAVGEGGFSPKNILKSIFGGGGEGKKEGLFRPIVLPTSMNSEGSAILDQVLRGGNKFEVGNSNWSWISGRADPIAMKGAGGEDNNGHVLPKDMQVDFTADSLPHTKLSEFIEKKIRELVNTLESNVEGIDQTICVREISCCNQSLNTSEVILDNFDNAPSHVAYRSRSIMMFQKIDNCDVAIFSMYVQEYDSDESGPKRVYLAYLDSVEFFRPRAIRSNVYHEIVVSYFADAKRRGFEKVHIWSCPPTRGNNFIFWGHPSNQKTPNRLRLQSWYQSLCARAMEVGIVSNVKSLYDESFEEVGATTSGTGTAFAPDRLPACPPVLAGDYWLDEVGRINKQQQKRSVKNWSSGGGGSKVRSTTTM